MKRAKTASVSKTHPKQVFAKAKPAQMVTLAKKANVSLTPVTTLLVPPVKPAPMNDASMILATTSSVPTARPVVTTNVTKSPKIRPTLKATTVARKETRTRKATQTRAKSRTPTVTSRPTPTVKAQT